MANFEIDQSWAVDDAPILVMGQQWVFDAYFKARGSHEASYSIAVAAQHEAQYGCGVAAQHEAPVHYTVHGRHEAQWTLTAQLAAQFESSYDMQQYAFVANQHEAEYSVNVSMWHAAEYANAARVTAAHSADYEQMQSISIQHEAGFDDMVRVTGTHEAAFDDMVRVTEGHLVMYGDALVVRQTMESAYDDMILVAAQHQGNYGSMVKVVNTHTAAFDDALRVNAYNVSLYGDAAVVKVAHAAEYGEYIKVAGSHSAEYGNMVSMNRGHIAVWDDVGVVQAAHEAPYQGMAVARRQFYSGYLNMERASLGHEAPYALMATVKKQHEAGYTATTPVAQQHETRYDMTLRNPVTRTHTAFWTMLADSITETPSQVFLDVGGTQVGVIELLISSTEDDGMWSCRAVLASMEDYALFSEGTQFSVTLGTDTYVFRYNTRGIRRDGPAQRYITIEGLSPAMALREPRTALIDRSYEEATLFHDMIEDILGQSVTWNDFPDWSIPAYRVAAEGAIPFDFAKQLVETAGGLLESNLDGTLSVRRKYRYTIPDYPIIAPDQVYSDLEDNLSVSENYDLRDGYNLFRVTEADTAYADQIEFVRDEYSETEGKLRAYPSPWRTSIIIRTTDGGGNVFLGNDLWLTRQETETVEFVEGTADLRYPAESVDSVVWHSVSLGGIIHLPYTAVLTTGISVNQGYGLADITYTVRYLEYDTAAVLGSVVQYVVEDIS